MAPNQRFGIVQYEHVARHHQRRQKRRRVLEIRLLPYGTPNVSYGTPYIAVVETYDEGHTHGLVGIVIVGAVVPVLQPELLFFDQRPSFHLLVR